MDIEKLSNVFGAETIKKIYEEGLSGSVIEVGKTLTDLVKALRLFTAPIQLLSNYQDRLTKKLEAVITAVPTEKQVESPAEICGPIIENLKYVKEGSYLEAFYLNLLKRSIDHDRVSEAHPAFIKIIEQLSRDEAYILSKMKKELVWTEYECELKNGIYKNVKAINFSFDHQELYFPEHFKVYIEHMQFLNLFYIRNHGLIKIENGISIRRNNYEVSGFGELFIKACVSDEI